MSSCAYNTDHIYKPSRTHDCLVVLCLSCYDVLLYWLFCSVLLVLCVMLSRRIMLCRVVWCRRWLEASLDHSYIVSTHLLFPCIRFHTTSYSLFSPLLISLLLVSSLLIKHLSSSSLTSIIPHALCTPPTPSSPSCYLHLMLSQSTTQTCLLLEVKITCWWYISFSLLLLPSLLLLIFILFLSHII